eukprot:1156603-Pelagomonas_calceolata.AAC.8
MWHCSWVLPSQESSRQAPAEDPATALRRCCLGEAATLAAGTAAAASAAAAAFPIVGPVHHCHACLLPQHSPGRVWAVVVSRVAEALTETAR